MGREPTKESLVIWVGIASVLDEKIEYYVKNYVPRKHRRLGYTRILSTDV